MSEYTRTGTPLRLEGSPKTGCKSAYVDPDRPGLWISLHRKLTRRERFLAWGARLDILVLVEWPRNLADRLDCLFGHHLWNWEHDGRLMEPRCQRSHCRRWMPWGTAEQRKQWARKGQWIHPWPE